MNQKVVLVTGASSGLGQCIAVFLSKRGFKVYGTSRSSGRSLEGVTMIKMDVTKKSEVEAAIDEIIKKEGKIDVLINNAGIGMAGSVEDSASEDFLNVINTNLIGPYETSKAVLPFMRKQGSGKIINVSSIASRFGLPFRSAYCASKSALDGLTEALRMEVKRFGIEVCSIQPGDIKTNINENRVVSTQSVSAYEPSFSRCFEIVNKDVEVGVVPEYFAKEIFKIINSKRVKRAYILGKPTQKLSVFLKSVLPVNLFERIIMGYYKVD